MLGHPTIFLKVLHYALFGSSPTVKQHLFDNGVNPDTVHLNDIKFFKAVVFMLVSSSSRLTFVGEHFPVQMLGYTGAVL